MLTFLFFCVFGLFLIVGGAGSAYFKIYVENTLRFSRNGKCKVTFKKERNDNKKLYGVPFVFSPSQSAFMLLIAMCIGVFMLIVFVIITSRPLFGSLITIAILAVTGLFVIAVILYWVLRYNTKLFLYQNGFVWKSMFRTECFFYNEIDYLYFDNVSRYAKLKFVKNNKTLLKLTTMLFQDIVYFENIFSKNHPYVDAIITMRF